jgi:hypothetical protein
MPTLNDCALLAHFPVSVSICPEHRCFTSAHRLFYLALFQRCQTRPPIAIPLLIFNRALVLLRCFGRVAIQLYNPIELASFALVASGSVQQALSAMPPSLLCSLLLRWHCG